MRIHLDNCSLSSRSGPNTFAQRLCQRLIERGHNVVTDDGTDADASIVFIERSGRPLGRKIIQRLDGIWTKPSEFSWRNRPIQDLYRAADAVVWQSSFDRRMTEKHWGDRPGRIIHNGIDPHVVVGKNTVLNIRDEYEHVFVCSANWHPQKRLKANTELFFHLLDAQFPHACLIVLGSNPDCYVAHPHVFYAGSLNQDQYMQVYRSADWMLHLAYADHCPNVVIEALASDCPVVCSNVGGTAELVKDYGVVVNEGDFNFEPFDYDAPPSIDVTDVVLPARSCLGEHIDVSIDRCVDEYLSLLDEVA